MNVVQQRHRPESDAPEGRTQQSARRGRRNHSCDILPKIPNHVSVVEGTDLRAFAIYVSEREYGKLLSYALQAA